MSQQPVGSLWLKEHFNLLHHNLTHSSYIGSKPSIELTSKGNIEQVYGARYGVSPGDALNHIEFLLKYDDLNLDFLTAIFKKLSQAELEAFIRRAPGSKYARKIG